MIKTTSSQTDLDRTLSEAAARYDIPGAQAVLLSGDEMRYSGHGVLRLDTQAPVRPDSRFHTGSSVKMLTVALVMVAVDHGFLDLDSPVQVFLPKFRVESASASAQITVRQLMNHTSGFDGDFFVETGQEDDCLAQYVAACANLEQVTDPGEMHAYSNASFSILAHLAETALNMTWRAAVSKYLTGPLGMTSFVDTPSQSDCLQNVAYGHIQSKETALQICELLDIRCLAPAGAGPLSTASDLAKFCGALLRGGGPILSTQSVAEMTKRQVEGPSETFASAWGLGMMLFDWTNEQTLFGHDGAVPGQNTYIRLHRETQCGLVLMTNGGDTASFADAMFDATLAPLVGASPKPLARARLSTTGLAAYSGSFGTRAANISVSDLGDRLHLHCEPTPEGAGNVPQMDVELTPIDTERFIGIFPGRSTGLIQRFLKFDGNGVPQAINFRGRVFPRRSANSARQSE